MKMCGKTWILKKDIKNHLFLLFAMYKLNKEVSAFGNTEIQKRKFHNSEQVASYNAFRYWWNYNI